MKNMGKKVDWEKEVLKKKEEFDAGHAEFEIPGVHPGRDFQIALQFKS